MSKYIYLLVFDRSRDWHDPNCCDFLKLPLGTDLAGHITSKAKRNNTTPDNIRMFVYESKRIWDGQRTEWVRGVDWSRMSFGETAQ